MSEDALKLTAYFGERDRAEGRFLSDVLLDRFGAARLATSALFRGLSGFGGKHRLRTDRLLTLSEDLPLVAVAVDERARIEAVAEAVDAVMGDGLLSLERARLWRSAPDAEGPGAAKLTVYVGRRERVDGRSAARAVVDVLHRRGVAGASVLLGVDGTAHGERHRASFVGRNAGVPLMVISVGDAEPIAAAAAEIAALLPRPLMTVERVEVLKRDGRRLAAPPPPEREREGDWAKLTVYASEASRSDGAPLHEALLHRLRRENAAGVTILRGIWGYHGDHAPHGDRLLALRRRVPVLGVVVDEPARAARWWELIDGLTETTGLVTWERVPVAHVRIGR